MRIKTVFLLIMHLIIFSASVYSGEAVPYIFNLPTSTTSGARILVFDNGHRYFDPEKHSTNVNIAFSYGITDSLDVSLARSFKNRDTVAGLKYTFIRDDLTEDNFLSLAFVGGVGYKEDTNHILKKSDRISFFLQTVIGKHLFMNQLGLGFVPVFAYNTDFYNYSSGKDFSIGAGFFVEVYIFDRISLCGEIIMNLYGFAFKYMNYNAGIKYTGYRHTFSLWIGNNGGYSPVEYITGNTVLEPRAAFAFTREFDL